MPDFGNCGSVIDHPSSEALQMFQESAIDCFTVYGIDYTDMFFLCYHVSARRSKGMWGNNIIEIGTVIHGRIRGCYLCFTYKPIFAVSFVFRVRQERECERSAIDRSYIFISLLQGA